MSVLFNFANMRLSVAEPARYKSEQPAEVDALATKQGIWIYIVATLALGRKQDGYESTVERDSRCR